MFYDYSFTIPANTAKRTPQEEKVYLPPGVIHRIEIGFPGGCAGLAHITLRHGLNQLWPSNADGSFNSDNYTIPINEHYRIEVEPFILVMVGWNLDDTYPHTIEVRFGLLSPAILEPEAAFVAAFKKLLKRLRV